MSEEKKAFDQNAKQKQKLDLFTFGGENYLAEDYDARTKENRGILQRNSAWPHLIIPFLSSFCFPCPWGHEIKHYYFSRHTLLDACIGRQICEEKREKIAI